MAGPGGMKRTARQTPTQTLVVWDLRTLGLEAERARRVRYELSMAVKRLPGFRLLDERKPERGCMPSKCLRMPRWTRRPVRWGCTGFYLEPWEDWATRSLWT